MLLKNVTLTDKEKREVNYVNFIWKKLAIL